VTFRRSLSPAQAFVTAIVVVAFLGVLDRLTGPDLSFSIFYLLPVAIATWWGGRFEGIVVGMASAMSWLMADVFVDPVRMHTLTPYWEAVVQLGFFIAFSETLSRLRVRAERERKFLTEVQRNLLPASFPAIEGLDVACSWEPALAVGGDYYDVIDLGHQRLGFCIADVSGKGMDAALIMSNLQAAVRVLARRESSPARLCEELNRHLCDSVTVGRFITFFYGVLDVASGRLLYTNAGHPAPLLLRRDGSMLRLKRGGPVLGFFRDHEWLEGEELLDAGDRLLLVTDGLTEARNDDDDEFGEERVGAALAAHSTLDGRMVIEALLNDVRRFNRGHFEDDVTLMTIALIDGDAAAGVTRPPGRDDRRARSI